MALLSPGDLETLGIDAAREMLATLLQWMPEKDVVATIRECYAHQHKREELASSITDPDSDC